MVPASRQQNSSRRRTGSSATRSRPSSSTTSCFRRRWRCRSSRRDALSLGGVRAAGAADDPAHRRTRVPRLRPVGRARRRRAARLVVVSYRQLIKAYPSGGGDYEVAHKNLGEMPGVVVASALLVDYVLTVAVSVASGVDNIISAIPELNPAASSSPSASSSSSRPSTCAASARRRTAFAIPTYVFIGTVVVMIVVGLARTVLGDRRSPRAPSTPCRPSQLTQAAVILLVLRAFSSGCSALTGVEAVSNGVPAFRKPKVAQRPDDARAHGRDRDPAVRRAHRARADLAACTTPRTRATSSASTARPRRSRASWRRSRRRPSASASIPFYVIQAATALRAAARGEHGVQRLPAARLGARPRRLRAEGAQHPRRPARVLERHDHPRRSPRSAS